jgi:hypothetical protein
MSRTKTATLLDAAATGTNVTDPLDTDFCTVCSFQVTKTGNLASTTIQIQSSHDNINWINVGSAGTLVAGTNPQTILLSTTATVAPYHRLNAPTTGSGNLKIIGFCRDNG